MRKEGTDLPGPLSLGADGVRLSPESCWAWNTPWHIRMLLTKQTSLHPPQKLTGRIYREIWHICVILVLLVEEGKEEEPFQAAC